MSHNLLPQLDKAALDYEFGESRLILERQLQQEIRSFCYPNGDSDERVRDTAAAAGYDNAVSTAWGLNRREHDSFALLRCDINSNRFKNRNGRLSAARTALRLANLQPGLQ